MHCVHKSVVCRIGLLSSCPTREHDTLQHSERYCKHTVIHCVHNSVSATHCNTLQRTATHCNALQHTATHFVHQNACDLFIEPLPNKWAWHTAIPSRPLATHCNTLQHTATHYAYKRESYVGYALTQQVSEPRIVVVCCSVLQCVAVCCSVLQCAAV